MLRKGLLLLSLLLLLTAVKRGLCLRCDRTPEGTTTPPTQTGHHYVIEISGNPETYVPGEQYTLFLRSSPNKKIPAKFRDFLLLIEHEQSERTVDSVKHPSVGTLQLYGDMLTKFSETCRNGVIQTNSLPKSEIQVLWLAPPAGSGCVAIRATVVETKDVWYSEDGPLSRILCEEVLENDDVQPNILKHCCACDEAKYEVTFEGMWSRNTHPKDFPQNEWSTRFSDIIGASHTVDYTFWNYGDIASEGLRQLAENGNTRMLESELKAKSEHIRTIIKARGISYPNITGKTFAVFRVDNRHHLISLVSKLDPSPDWLVGVSSLELCLRNCTWVESRILNLYPWDAGTDDGVTYTAPNQPSSPRQAIRRIKSNSPNDPRSPFYDASGSEIKPLAKLYLSRQRLYEKTCDHSMDYNEDVTNSESSANCELDKWSDWSVCSVTCGRGVKYRQRGYKYPDSKKNAKCRDYLTQRSVCYGPQRHCHHQDHKRRDDPECEQSDWGEWSTCSATCGRGVKTRSRTYKNRAASKRCAAGIENPPILEQTIECEGEHGTCEGEEMKFNENVENCQIDWSDWSPCSSSCGRGTKRRVRNPNPSPLYYNKPGYKPDETDYDSEDEDDESDICAHITEQVVECINPHNPVCDDNPEDRDVSVCGLTKDSGTCRSNVDRWYFNAVRGHCEIFSYSGCEGNPNNFKTLELCEKICKNYKMDNKSSTSQGKRNRQKNSGFLDYQNDETRASSTTNKIIATDLNMHGIDSWSHRIDNRSYSISTENIIEEPLGPVINCEVSRWSSWGPCNVTNGICGSGYKSRNRHIRLHPMNGGRRCPTKLMKKKKCEVPCNLAPHLGEYGNAQDVLLPEWGPTGSVRDLKIDCIMSPWSAWSPCSQTCGSNAVQQRTRSITRAASGRGRPCEHRVEHKKCSLLACPE